MNFKVLGPDFFERRADTVAKDILGKLLVLKSGKETKVLTISETEAYLGVEDKACHASRGLSERTKPMFGPAGHFYIYLIYGMYYMINFVCDKEGEAHAVLLRGTLEISGPGRISKFLKVDKSFNGKKIAPETGLFVAENPDFDWSRYEIKKYPRVGIDYAQEWKDKKLRFVLSEKL